MPLYLSPYTGSGTKADPFRPRAAQGRWSAVDLRPDPTVVDGFALCYVPSVRADATLVQLGESKDEALSRATEIVIGNRLGKTFDGSNATLSDLVGELCVSPPSVNGWKPFLPALVGGRRQLEIWLNHERWVLQPVLAGGAFDDFNRANETPLAAPWAQNGTGSTFTLDTNTLRKPSGLDDGMYYYTGAASGADQYSEIQITTFPTQSDCGPAVRIGSGATLNGYIASYFGNFYKFVSGVYTSLATHGDTPTANHYCRLTASGSTLTLLRDATTPATTARGTTSDSSLTSGQPGVNSYESGIIADNWRGGDLASAGPALHLVASPLRW